MAAETENVTLGSGTLYLNGIDVGHLKGNVVLAYTRNTVDFKPANMTGVVKKFVVGEEVRIRASMAEFKCSNYRLAMGHSAAIGSSAPFSTAFSYDPSSFADRSVAGKSYDYVKFGGHKTCTGVPLEFVHVRDDGKKVIVVLYSAVSTGEIEIPFNEEEVNMYDVEWMGLADEDRSAGDQIGQVVNQVT